MTAGTAVAWRAALYGLCAWLALTGRGTAEERLAGPVPAVVVAVLDGDTLEVRARVWLGLAVTTRVRLAGVDAPELSGKCARERALGARARAYVTARIEAASGTPGRVVLHDIRNGKFAGRVLARVETARGEDLGRGLVAAGLARPYHGKRRLPWCAGTG
ncbi:MAG: thermonuclease family protein [Kiloniellaceae bacterium]